MEVFVANWSQFPVSMLLSYMQVIHIQGVFKRFYLGSGSFYNTFIGVFFVYFL